MKTLFSVGATLLLISGVALAQPGNAGMAQNPANMNMGGFGGRNNLTTAQREQIALQTAQIREINQRQSLTLAGVTDLKAQDAIIAFQKEEETARQALQQKWQQLTQSLRGTEVTDAQIATQLNLFRNALEDERTRRATAVTALDAKIGFSKNARLDAMLTVAGIIGEEAAFMNSSGNTGGGRGNLLGNIMGAMMGGMGGGMGGPGGGMGGPGGGMGGGPGGGMGGMGGGPGGGGPGGGGGG